MVNFQVLLLNGTWSHTSISQDPFSSCEVSGKQMSSSLSELRQEADGNVGYHIYSTHLNSSSQFLNSRQLLSLQSTHLLYNSWISYLAGSKVAEK